MNGKGLQFIEIYMGIGGLEFGSGVTRSPGLVLISRFFKLGSMNLDIKQRENICILNPATLNTTIILFIQS